MKQNIIFAICGGLSFVSTCVAIKLELPVDLGECRYDTLFTTTAPTLTALKSELEDNDALGTYRPQTYNMDFKIRGNRVDCCIEKTTNGQKWVIDPKTDIDLKIVIEDCLIKLPVWEPPTPVCPSAASEWDRVLGLIKGHELGHHEGAKRFFSSSNHAQLLSHAESQFVLTESECVEGEEPDLQDAGGEAVDSIMEMVDNYAGLVAALYQQEQNSDHENLWAYEDGPIDLSKECPSGRSN